MFDTLTLPEIQHLVTAEQATELKNVTTFTVATALRAASGCHEIVQVHGDYGNGENTACALSASVLVARRLGYLA